ncbi:LPS assembly lipoprotein LptE [Alsobacter sp. KACC 23698]|uniref:LPS assembly lipoprotein LptE n=1 Tax=Alsobacter sp. KACC 23698 TaxID=3149229 RepID=A0AAU7JET4_9HYPH
MSSPDRLLRACRSVLVLGALALPLGGCLRPLYGEAKIGGGLVDAGLKSIVVDQVQDRLGHYLVEELGFELNGSGEQVPHRYRLTMNVRENVQAAIVNTATGRADSATIMATVDFALVEINGGREIMRAKAFASASYDRSPQRFAAVRAARDAEIRIAKTLADQLRTRIAAKLATGT